MKNDAFQKLIYQLVSKLFVLPIYKFVFRGHLIGIDNIPQKNAFIMVSNHGSLLDPPLLGHALGRNISFMAKAELFKIPLLGFIIKACGAYPVKRGIVDKKTIKTACKKLSNNNCIGIFRRLASILSAIFSSAISSVMYNTFLFWSSTLLAT